MKVLYNNFKFDVPFNIDRILDLFKNSVDFKIENSSNWSGQFYTSSIINKVYYRQQSRNIIQISENGGLGGLLEVIGEIKVTPKDENTSELNIRFQMGIFPISTPLILTIIFGLAGLMFIFIDSMFSYIVFGLMFISIILYLVKLERVRFF